MGRWAQQRRRGGGPAPAASVVPGDVSIDHVETVNANYVQVFFSANVTDDNLGGAVPQFSLDGVNPDDHSQATSNSIYLQFSGGYTPLGPWLLTASLPFLDKTVTYPASGNVT